MELSSRADEESNRSESDPKQFEFGSPPARRHSMTEIQRQNSVGSGGQQQNSSPSPVSFLQEKLSHQHYLNEFRVEACPLFKQHQCQQHRPFTCFKWHFANQRRRRPVKRSDGSFNYSPDIYCDKYDENTGICPDGDDCVFLHRVSGDVERKYHLRYYKTAQCVHPTDSRGQCVKNGAHCAFAHTAHDIRPPMVAKTSSPKTSYLSVLQFDQHEVGFSTVVDGEGRDKTSFVIEDPQWHSQDHVLSCYKTEQCRKPARLCRQGYACPFYHNSKDRRRPPALCKYRSTPCPAAKTIDEWLDPDICEAGDGCQYCHTRTEQQFHPEIYKSTKCNDMLEHGYCPRAVFCAFAHHDSELHAPRNPYVGSTQPSPKESPNGFSISTEQLRFDSPSNNGMTSYANVLKTQRSPIGIAKQGYPSSESIAISSSYPKAPGYERGYDSFSLGRNDQRPRTQSCNIGQLDAMKRAMILAGGISCMDPGNAALTSHPSLHRSSDSGFNVISDSSLDLGAMGLELPRIEERNSQFNLFTEVMSTVGASLDPAWNESWNLLQPEQIQNDIFSGNFDSNMFNQDYPNGEYDEFMKNKGNESFSSLSEKCQYLEDALNKARHISESWRIRFEQGEEEKNRILAERNQLLAYFEQMQMKMTPSFVPPPQMVSPLSINLPQDNFDGGIRPSASLQHSPPYNIFGSDCDTGAPACARCGRDRSRTGSDSQSSCPVCSN